MPHLLVETQFQTQNRFPLLPELLWTPKTRFHAPNLDPPEAAGNAPKCEKTMEKGAAGAAP